MLARRKSRLCFNCTANVLMRIRAEIEPSAHVCPTLLAVCGQWDRWSV